MFRHIAQRLVLLALACSLGFVLVEMGVRVWLTRLASAEQFVSYASLDQLRARTEKTGASFSRFSPHLYVGFTGSPNYHRGENRHNALGFRGDPIPLEKPNGEYRIVCLGGSTTYTSAVRAYRKSYPDQLQATLRARGYPNVRVINAGLPGYTTWETLVLFEFRILDLDPDMIIIYHGVNDAGARMVWPPSAYRGDNSGAKGPAPGLHRPLPLHLRSTAIRLLLIRFGLAQSPGALETTFVKVPPTGHGLKYLYQTRRGTYPNGIFNKIDAVKMLRKNPPIYFERNLEHILVIAKHRGIQPVLATFAYIVREKGGDGTAAEEIRYGMDELNEVIVRVGADLEVPVFDFAASFPKDPALFTGGVHLNGKGARLKAELFAEFLVGAALIPKPVPTLSSIE